MRHITAAHGISGRHNEGNKDIIGLTDHPDKTCYIVRGSKNFKARVEQQLIDEPLVFDTFNVKQRVSEKYLGQVLHSGCPGCSATATVRDRMGKI